MDERRPEGKEGNRQRETEKKTGTWKPGTAGFLLSGTQGFFTDITVNALSLCDR